MLSQGKNINFFILVSILFGIYCFVFGQSGLLERIILSNKTAYQQGINDHLAGKNQELYEKYEKYRTGVYNKEESQKAGYFKESARVIYFKSSKKEKEASRELVKIKKIVDNRFYNYNIEHLRVLWVSISLLILLFYFIKVRKSYTEEEE